MSLVHLVDEKTFYYWTWNHLHSAAEGCITLCGKGFEEVAAEQNLKYTVPIMPAIFAKEHPKADICPECLRVNDA